VAAASLLLGSWVHPLHAVIRGDLHGDSSLLTWDIWNVTESLLHLRNPYRTDRLYFPVGANLTSHTYAPGLAPVGLAAKALSGGDPTWPIAAYRAAIWLCFALGLFTAHHALRALGASSAASLGASLAWAFAPVFRTRALETHLVTLAFLAPLVTWALARLVARPSRGRALAFAVATASCLYFSEYYTPFLWLGLLVLAGAAALVRDSRAAARAILRALGWKGAMGAGAAFLVAASPFLLNWSPSKALRFKPDQAYFESANLAGFVVPDPAFTPLYAGTPLERWNGRVRRGVGGAQAFLGFPVLVLAAVGLTGARSPRARLLALLAAAFLVLSLGPELKVLGTNTRVPLPYRALMAVPPFDLARAPARLSALGLWPLVVLMALGLSDLARRLGRVAGALLAAVAGAWILAEVVCGGPAVRPFEPPEGLRRLGPGAVLDLPLSARDSFAMLLQTLHGKPIATGYVSRLTAEQADHVGRLDALIAEGARPLADSLRAMGIGNVVVARGAPEDLVAALPSTGLVVVDVRGVDEP
jgi:hypothetical protein